MHYNVNLLRHLRFTIGKNICALREEKRLSLQKLSALSGVAEEKLGYYEQGRFEIRLEDMLRLACILGVPVERLLA